MSELFPQSVIFNAAAQSPTSVVPDVRRMMVDVRPYMNGVYNNQMAQGSAAASAIKHQFFMNGTNWDLSQSTSTTSYTISPASGTFIVYGIVLEMVTSASAVLNGSCFGGQFTGLLGLGVQTPGALANGLALNIVAGGVTTRLATLFTNEDYGQGQYPIAGGSLTGGVYTFRARYEMRQPLVSGTSDSATWLVQDNMTGRGIAELRAIAFGFTV